jgi:hypothetical protein
MLVDLTSLVLRGHTSSSVPVMSAGDIDDEYLQKLEDKGRGAGRDRPGQDIPTAGSNSNNGPAKAEPLYV